MTEAWNTPTRVETVPRNSPYPHSNNERKQTQRVTQNQLDEPMLNLRVQIIRAPSRNDVIAGTRNRPIPSTPQDARVV